MPQNLNLGALKIAQELADQALLAPLGEARLAFSLAEYGSREQAHAAAYRIQLAYGRVRSILRRESLDAQMRSFRAEAPRTGEAPFLDPRTPYDTLLTNIIDTPEGVALRVKRFEPEALGIEVF